MLAMPTTSRCVSLCRLSLACLFLFVGFCLSLSGSSCPENCGTYGTCFEPLGRCDCPWNRTGSACLDLHKGFCIKRPEINTCDDGHPTLCVNACNGRGACMGGVCHCQKGFYGLDCSLSTNPSGGMDILAGQGYRPSSRGPKIFVYELPPEFNVKRDIHKIDRPPLHLALFERILTAGHRTTNGDEADFFYIPITSRDLKKAFLLMPAIDYIAQNWPYWNRTHGARHIMPVEGDVGTCELPLRVRMRTENVTFLQFWGMHDFHPSWGHIFHNKIPCHVPGRDIVVPFMAMSSHDRFVIETPLRPGNLQRERNITFFFSGGICGSGRYNALPPNCTYYKQLRYSGGVRQMVYEKFHGRPGWRVVPRTDDYARDYASSKFCLAAPGGGWGKRGIVAAMYGCIPVVATDFLHEAFEPEMDWGRFGVRVAQRDIPKLGDMLDSMDDAKVAELQRKTVCAAQHFHWSTNLGGIMKETGEFDAFATIMAILRMRKKYPNEKPERFYDLDQEFRDFIDCKHGAPLSKLGAAASSSPAAPTTTTTTTTTDMGAATLAMGEATAAGAAAAAAANATEPVSHTAAPTALANETRTRPGITNTPKTRRKGKGAGKGGRRQRAPTAGSRQTLQAGAAPAEPGAGPASETTASPAAAGVGHAPYLCTMYIGPGQHKYNWTDVCPPAKYFMRRKIGPPGGAICVNATNLASCTRFD